MSDISKRFPHMGGGTEDGETARSTKAEKTIQERLRLRVHTGGQPVTRINDADIDEAADRIDELEEQARLLRGAMDAQDEREERAGDRIGLSWHEHGCDWPEAVADLVLHLRGRVDELEAIVAKLPKTADGVTVTPKMRVYYPYCDGTGVGDDIVGNIEDPTLDNNWGGLYSTEAAAREAMERGA